MWRTTPTPVSGGLAFKAIASLGSTTCGVTTAGVAYCWGLNHKGQIGDNSTTTRLVPTAVAGGNGAVDAAKIKSGCLRTSSRCARASSTSSPRATAS